MVLTLYAILTLYFWDTIWPMGEYLNYPDQIRWAVAVGFLTALAIDLIIITDRSTANDAE